MENVKEIIAQNLVSLRKSKRMTQQELAEKLNYSDKAVSKWEQERSYPDVTLLPRIAKLFSVSIDSLFGTSNNRMSNN